MRMQVPILMSCELIIAVFIYIIVLSLKNRCKVTENHAQKRMVHSFFYSGHALNRENRQKKPLNLPVAPLFSPYTGDFALKM